jgi:hypothetical protein
MGSTLRYFAQENSARSRFDFVPGLVTWLPDSMEAQR